MQFNWVSKMKSIDFYDEEDYNFTSSADSRGSILGASFQVNRSGPYGVSRLATASSFNSEGGSRMYTGATSEGTFMWAARPMTAASRAGYRTLKGSGERETHWSTIKENDSRHVVRQLEKTVQELIDNSSRFARDMDFRKSLETAKEARKKEREVYNFQNGLLEDAVDTYNILLKLNKYLNTTRLRVNIGNILYQQGKYRDAIKMYRMALDQIPDKEREMGYEISFNLCKTFLKLGYYRKAIQHLEAIMEFSPKHEVGFNLVLCYYATGDVIKAKKGFAKLSSIAKVRFFKSDSPQVDSFVQKFNEVDDRDEFALFINAKRKEANHYLFNAARLIAPILDMEKWDSGYRWVADQVYRKGNIQVANQLEIEQALAHLRKNEASLAIELLKSFESKSLASKTMAATNLSSIYFLERDYKSAHSFADMAVSNSRYNAQAYVNKGNCLFADGDHAGAREMYIEAIGANSGCIDAIFNLGLVYLQLDQEKDAMTLFERIQLSTPGNPSVLYQLANLCEKSSEFDKATKWLTVLNSDISSDAAVLYRIGRIYAMGNDDEQAFHSLLESYKIYPVNMEVISWLAVRMVKNEMYEQSIQLFDRCCQIQPSESKWPLMICSCYRRLGNHAKSHHWYTKTYAKFPDNIECESFS